jgi:hypothetical protein
MNAALALLELTPRWVLAALLAASVAWGGVEAFQVQAARTEAAHAERDKANAERDVATLTASLETARADAEAQRAEWAAKLSEAERNAKKRETDLRDAAAAAGTELDGMRGDIANLRRSLAGATASAAAERAVAIGVVLQSCSQKYKDMAGVADRHANDIRTMMEAWPK